MGAYDELQLCALGAWGAVARQARRARLRVGSPLARREDGKRVKVRAFASSHCRHGGFRIEGYPSRGPLLLFGA